MKQKIGFILLPFLTLALLVAAMGPTNHVGNVQALISGAPPPSDPAPPSTGGSGVPQLPGIPSVPGGLTAATIFGGKIKWPKAPTSAEKGDGKQWKVCLISVPFFPWIIPYPFVYLEVGPPVPAKLYFLIGLPGLPLPSKLYREFELDESAWVVGNYFPNADDALRKVCLNRKKLPNANGVVWKVATSCLTVREKGDKYSAKNRNSPLGEGFECRPKEKTGASRGDRPPPPFDPVQQPIPPVFNPIDPEFTEFCSPTAPPGSCLTAPAGSTSAPVPGSLPAPPP